ncbi:HAD family hydrolase [Desulforhopalus sp. 52FAK]
MRYQAVFLDMDHTLCDTERADRLGLRDFQDRLSQRFDHGDAIRIGEKYLEVIYGSKSDVPGWLREEEETEVDYRAKLLEKTIEEETNKVWGRSELLSYANVFMELRIKHFAFFPGTIEMLGRLRKTYKLVLISNGPLFSQKVKVEKVEMTQHVDHILIGGALKRQKPHPSIFMLACQKVGCHPSEAIHVGDKLDADIQGAVNAGITSVWLNSTGEMLNGDPTPNYTIRNILELEKLLECQ